MEGQRAWVWGVNPKNTGDWGLCPRLTVAAPTSRAESRGLFVLWSAPLCGSFCLNCLGHRFRDRCLQVEQPSVPLLSLPCEPLSLDLHKSPKNALIITACEEDFHKSLFWETSGFGNLWISYLFQSQHSVKSHRSDWFHCFDQLKRERLQL